MIIGMFAAFLAIVTHVKKQGAQPGKCDTQSSTSPTNENEA